jgi:ferric-dicitrate binding protein FerR (iron transport regulator)
MGSVLRTEHGNLEGGRIEWLPHHALEAGAPLHVGDSYTSDGTTLIALSGGGTLRVAPGSAFEVSADAEVLLNSGRVYLDFPRGVDGFVLRTSTGTVEHIGTQYEVTALARGMRVRVREGSVSVHTLNGVQPAEAGTEIVVYADEVVRQPVPTYGPEWKWAESIAPEFDIEDQPLADFLNWVARETGRRIVFADDRTRQLATETRLHGSIHGLNPSQALERVLSTTTLRCDVQENVIRVSSSR